MGAENVKLLVGSGLKFEDFVKENLSSCGLTFVSKKDRIKTVREAAAPGRKRGAGTLKDQAVAHLKARKFDLQPGEFIDQWSSGYSFADTTSRHLDYLVRLWAGDFLLIEAKNQTGKGGTVYEKLFCEIIKARKYQHPLLLIMQEVSEWGPKIRPELEKTVTQDSTHGLLLTPSSFGISQSCQTFLRRLGEPGSCPILSCFSSALRRI